MIGFGNSDWSYDPFEKMVIFPPDPLPMSDWLSPAGASPDDETIKANNLSTEMSDKDVGDTEITGVGPLTFDPTPQLEDDERHQHVAIDDQAKLM